jgi:SAM-dependent methyltransferase
VSAPARRPDASWGGSQSMSHPGYWWYRGREQLLAAALGRYAGTPQRLLDVGSADGPSVGWLEAPQKVAIDLDIRGLRPGRGVCASALKLPFRDATFDLVSAFDVVEHCEPEAQALSEFARVLVPGGRLLLSVPAYQWAWTDHDVRAGHHRRYTRDRLVRAVEGSGLRVVRATYAFAAVFPLFVAERLARKARNPGAARPPTGGLPSLPPRVDRALVGLCAREARVLQRRDLGWGSSVLLAAEKG